MLKTFLLTGFEPFRHHRVNPSWDALALLQPTLPSYVVCRRLPVDFREAHLQLRKLLSEVRPLAVLCMGLAEGHSFRIERVARRPLEMADVTGSDLSHGRWPWPLLNAALCQARVAVAQSSNAGRYVCESTYWSLLNAHAPLAPAWAGFLHVPHASDVYPVTRTAQAIQHVIRSSVATLELG